MTGRNSARRAAKSANKKLLTPTGKVHRNFKLSQTSDKLLRSISKRENRNQTLLLESMILTFCSKKGKPIVLTTKALNIIAERSRREGRDMMAILEDCVMRTLPTPALA